MPGQFYVYIITSRSRKPLYIGVTNDLNRRLIEHADNCGNFDAWAGRYHCFLLIYYESFKYVNDAIRREKQLKGWTRKKKIWLIQQMDPNWDFLNSQFD